LRDVVVARAAQIRELRQALEARLADKSGSEVAAGAEAQGTAWETVAADLKLRLGRVESRAERLERQLKESRTALAAEHEARLAAEHNESELREELETLEAGFGGCDIAAAPAAAPLGLTVLYVGGRQAGIGHLREFSERCGAMFLHHDGGIEEREGLLPGLISRADAVLFPVDCISHAAMSLVKRLCQQAGKPYVPLRGAGLAPFCAALKEPGLRPPEV
jgi:hypothetical protein